MMGEEKERNKKERIRKEIQHEIESIFFRIFILPVNQKYIKKIQETYIDEKLFNVTHELVENLHKSYIKGNNLLSEIPNFRENLDQELDPVLDSIIDKLYGTYIDMINEKRLDIVEGIFEAYANVYTEKIVDIIAEKELEEQKYVGGEFKLIYTDHCALSCKIYFQSKTKKWGTVSLKTIPIETKYIYKKTLEELKRKKVIAFALCNSFI